MLGIEMIIGQSDPSWSELKSLKYFKICLALGSCLSFFLFLFFFFLGEERSGGEVREEDENHVMIENRFFFCFQFSCNNIIWRYDLLPLQDTTLDHLTHVARWSLSKL